MQTKKELLIFGATGGTGQAIVHTALDRGYEVTVFARNIQRAQHLFNGSVSRINFSEGDALNEGDVRRSIGSSLTAVVSAMGVFQKLPGRNDLTKATVNIIEALSASGPKRFLCISSIGTGESRNQGDFATRMIQKTTLRFTLQDKETQEAEIRASGLDWTIIRPSRLLDKGGPARYLTWTGEQPDKELVWSINRKQIASLTLDCLEDDTSIGKALNVTGTLYAGASEALAESS